MITRTKKILLIVARLLFSVCILGSLTSCSQEDTVTVAARRVGVAPTLDGLAGYITKSVKPEMPREQVEKALIAIAPLDVERGSLEDAGADWGPAACDKISIKLHPQGWQVWRIVACYDVEGKLVLLTSADPDYPSLNITVPPKR
jgi:hypothetical protein